MVRPIIKIAILCLTFQLLTGLSAPFEKESQGQVSNDQYRAKVLVHKGYPDYSVTLQLSDLEKGSEQELSFEAFFESIDELVLMAGEKLLVVGQLPQHAGVQIVIVDLRQNAVQDTIRTHYRLFTLSPNRRYLLHTTFYGRLEPPNQRKCLLLAYDLTLPAEKNRLSSAPNLSMENAGLPIFPRSNVDRSSYSIFEDPRTHVFISPFLWSEDSQRILFVEIVENKRFLVLVIIGCQMNWS